MSLAVLSYLLPSLILIAGLVDDLRSKKVHNWLTLSAAVIAIGSAGLFNGMAGLQTALLSLTVAIGLTIPLFLARMIGGGDVKLIFAFALATDATAVLWVLMYAFIWGALLGLIRVTLQKELIQLLINTAKIATFDKSRKQLSLHKIPFTVALVFGWLTHLAVGPFGGSL